MSSVKDFLKRKDIVITPQRYLIEALPPRGCARRRVSERNRRRRLLARRLKLSPKVTDEGRPCRHNPFAGNHSRFAPHPPLRGTFPLRGRLYYHHTTIRPIKKAPPVCGPAGQGWRERDPEGGEPYRL